MNKRWLDFLMSFGLMLLGVGLLFGLSVSFGPEKEVFSKTALFPSSDKKIAGGDEVPEFLPISHPTIPLTKDNTEFSGVLSAVSAFVVDDKTGTVFYSKNSQEVRPLASITKLMSALVLIDLDLNWDATTTIIKDDGAEGGGFVRVGDVFTAEDLWHVALIGSSNGAVNALARMSGVPLDNFVLRMNDKAKKLEMKSMHFVEPTGLDAGNAGSAEDAVKLLKTALHVDKISQALIVGEYYAHPLNGVKTRRVWSTDWLLNDWVPNDFGDGQVVGKTGYITDSGYNFVARFSSSTDRALNVVVLGTESNTARFTEARDLAIWGFNHFSWPQDPGYGLLVE